MPYESRGQKNRDIMLTHFQSHFKLTKGLLLNKVHTLRLLFFEKSRCQFQIALNCNMNCICHSYLLSFNSVVLFQMSRKLFHFGFLSFFYKLSQRMVLVHIVILVLLGSHFDFVYVSKFLPSYCFLPDPFIPKK